ncbi:MAG: hypothetical protein GX660_18365 [Clostridiaceae bacterium]|nr:hypothetical protein [Clostridiaceae bacterium]
MVKLLAAVFCQWLFHGFSILLSIAECELSIKSIKVIEPEESIIFEKVL